MINYIVYIIFMTVRAVIVCIPIKPACCLGSALGTLVYYLDKRHRRIVYKNISAAFGDSYTMNEKRLLARKVFKFQGIFFVEFIKLTPNALEHYSFSTEGTSSVAAVLAQGKGLVGLISHIGNWELLGQFFAKRGHDVWTIVRPQKNKYIDNFITKTRRQHGLHLITKRQALKTAIEKLREGKPVAILADQYAGSRAPKIPFFGTPVSTSPSAALLSIKTEAPLLAVFCIRKKCGAYEIITKGPFTSRKENLREKVADIMSQYNAHLEDMIRRYPDQWLWLHKRWKRVIEY